MKSLSLPKPLIITVVGLPGAGKSFFAKQFADTFGAPLVSYDRLRNELFNDPTYNKDEQEILARVADYQLGEVLKTKQTTVLDGAGFTRVDRMRLAKTAREAGYAQLIIWIQTDEATTKQRSLRRSSKQVDDKYSHLLTPEQYASFTKQFTPPNHSESYIVISGKHTYAAQVKVVLKRLAGARQETATTAAPPERPNAPLRRRQNITIR